MRRQKLEFFSPDDLLKRVPLLKRVAKDIVTAYEQRRNAKERLDELKVISKKFNSFEIQETIGNLRRLVSEYDREMEGYEKEIRLLGGALKDARRGLVYFYSERENRKIFLVWDYRHPNTVSWHELDESFADRTPIEFPKGAHASAIDSQDQ
jgi:hypothetical protein